MGITELVWITELSIHRNLYRVHLWNNWSSVFHKSTSKKMFYFPIVTSPFIFSSFCYTNLFDLYSPRKPNIPSWFSNFSAKTSTDNMVLLTVILSHSLPLTLHTVKFSLEIFLILHNFIHKTFLACSSLLLNINTTLYFLLKYKMFC